MTDPALVALSFLPVQLWRQIGEHRRAGQSTAALLAAIVAARWPNESGKLAELMAHASAAMTRAQAKGLAATTWDVADYPPLLAAITDPPPVLWTRGSIDALRRPAIAIVGSRAGSRYALEVAERLAADLASRGCAVVSGLARGVDSAAHRGAVSVGGSTIAVLGCGADVMYPPEHGALARSIEPHGLVLSELAPGTPPKRHFFPRRNRIISGLSRAVVVIEAGEHSGSLITARCALEQGREVLAVPGNVLNGRNRGAHALLRDGARIVETADDILEEVYGVGASARRAVGPLSTGEVSGMRATNSLRDPLLACLPPGETCDLDEIVERSGLPTPRLLARLFELELQGEVARIGGGRFVRVDRSC